MFQYNNLFFLPMIAIFIRKAVKTKFRNFVLRKRVKYSFFSEFKIYIDSYF